MDKKIRNFLDNLLENNILDQQIYENIINYGESNAVSQKSKVARALTLIGGLFVFSGLLRTLPLIWENLSYWAQLLLLITTTWFLFYAAGYSRKIDNQKLFIFKSNERVSSFLYLTSTLSFAAVIVFSFNIIQKISILNFSEDFAILIISTIVLTYSSYLYKKTFEIFQHIGLFYTLIFFLGSIGNLFLKNIEPWGMGLFITTVGIIWGLNTYSDLLKPSWLGYFLSSINITIGVVVLVEDLLSYAEIVSILILITGSILYIWISIKLSEQVIFYIGGLGLVINLPRLITELLPDNIWQPLILFIVGGVLVTVGLYLNTLRETIRKIT
jgi:hypothetical protein